MEQSNAQFNIPDLKAVGSTFIELNQLDTLHEYDKAADASGKATVTLRETDVNTHQINRLIVRSFLGKYHLSLPQTGPCV